MKQREIMQIIRGKRTKRTRPPPSSSESTVVTVASPPSTTTTTSSTEEEEDMANCLMLLAQGSGSNNNHGADVYRCKTCDKSFSSFQALGGHRTSHKKAKPADSDKGTVSFLTAVDDDDDHDGTALSLRIPPTVMMSSGGRKPPTNKVHECSICGAEFSSGQALGGHMRRHRVAAPQFPGCGGSTVQMAAAEKGKTSSVLGLDLNLPAPEEPNLVFGSGKGKQLLVFSPSLVGCRN